MFANKDISWLLNLSNDCKKTQFGNLAEQSQILASAELFNMWLNQSIH